MKNQKNLIIEALLSKGVKIPNPLSVDIDSEVDIEKISGERVSIYSGCKIYGASTLILPGATLGYEGPVTIENCQVGPRVNLKNGFFKESVFLEKSSMGYGSRTREGTILEEEASASHTVDLKQTILFPYVTLGSLVNFCDCFMAGGSSRKDHSEVGSSYIHFNYTPLQDKATPSLLGDVPRGVMLDQKPIFLGGQGGLVGPCRLEFGTLTTAGTICRKDELRSGRMIFERGTPGGSVPFESGMYRNVKRTVLNNIIYIANLTALRYWYRHVRSQFVADTFPEVLLDGLKHKIDMSLHERISRMEEFCEKMPASIERYQEILQENASPNLLNQKCELVENWPELKDLLEKKKISEDKTKQRDDFLENVRKAVSSSGKDYISVIKRLPKEEKAMGTRWLQGVVDETVNQVLKIIPAFA